MSEGEKPGPSPEEIREAYKINELVEQDQLAPQQASEIPKEKTAEETILGKETQPERVIYQLAPETQQQPETKKGLKEWVRENLRVLAAAGIISLAAGTFVERFWQSQFEMEPATFIEHVEKKQKLSGEQRDKLKQHLEELGQEYSPAVIRAIYEGDIAAEVSAEKIEQDPEIHGFENIGIDNNDLRNLWREGNYPRGTIKGNITRVKFIKEDKRGLGHYGLESVRAGGIDGATGEITLFGVPDMGTETNVKAVKDSLDWHFAHELGHINDWAHKKNLTPLERVEFLHEIRRAFKRKGSFRDWLGYVDSIRNPNKQHESYYKVREWWATLSEYYFTFPESLKEEAPQDYKLVEKWMKKYDRDFETTKAKAVREEIIKKIAIKPKQ